MRNLLKTKHLLLRSIKLDDADRIEGFASDYDIAKTTINIPHPYPKGSAVHFVKSILEKKEQGLLVNYVICSKQMNSFIGLIDLSIHPEHEHAELGYWIGKPYWNQGYGTEAATAIINDGFKNHHLNKIYARAFKNNTASRRIMEKVGMMYEGTQKQHFIRFGEYIDVVNYGIVKSDYEILEK